MTTKSDRQSDTDSEAGSVQSRRPGKLGAILCPTICAVLLVCVFAVSFVGTKMAYEQYDALCTGRRFDATKLYVFPNLTMIRLRPMRPVH